MNLKRSDLAMYRVRERREEVVDYIESYEAERWNGFLGGLKGIITFIISAIIFSAVAFMLGCFFHVEALIVLNYVWGIAAGLILSQVVRNQKNADVDAHLYNLKREYVELTKMSKELYFA